MAPMESPAQTHPLSTTRELPRLLNPGHLVANLWSERRLIVHLVRRQISQRYRGSIGGLLWSFLLPLVMLVTYTFVFGEVLKARFTVTEGVAESQVDYALMLFCGILIYTIFQESLGAAPTLMQFNANYVKRVVFPLEVLPLTTVAAATVNGVIATGILVLVTLGLKWEISSTLWLFPIVLAPMAMFTVGLTWFLASLGVFLRDVNQVIGIALTILFFMSPIFYPVERLPDYLQGIVLASPLTIFIENARHTLLLSRTPDWNSLGLASIAAFAIMQLGYAWFMKTKRGFADVL